MTVGNALMYEIGKPVDNNGDRMIVHVDLGRARDFADYDAETGFFKVHSTEVSVEAGHVGTYEITFYATTLLVDQADSSEAA